MRARGTGLIALGLLLIAAALFLTGYHLWDGARAEQSARQAVRRLEALTPVLPAEDSAPPQEVEVPDYVLDPEREMPEEEVDGVRYIGTLRIPALDLELPVVSQWSYAGLRLAPCRYAGSAYRDDLVIAAHNYRGHFGGLHRLAPGDAVTFTDLDGNVFHYEVAGLETLLSTAVEEMTSGEYALSLFTCTIGGQYRVTARCVRTGP